MAGPLQNLRWERFAREYASGESLASAYLRAGFDKAGKYAKFNASRLRNKPAVKARIDELMEQFAEQSAVKLEYLQHQLLPALRTNPQDLFDEHGELKPITELQRDCAAAIKSIKFHKETGKVSEVVLADKIAAAGLLLRSIGVGGPDIAVNATAIAAAGGGQVEPPRSDLDVARRMAFLLAKAAGDHEPPASAYKPACVEPVEDDSGDPESDMASAPDQAADLKHASADDQARQLTLDILDDSKARNVAEIRFAPLPGAG